MINKSPQAAWFPRPIDLDTDDENRPVFITGAPRCGSSWVGEILGSCDGARYVYEPLNPAWMPGLRGHIRLFRYHDDPSGVPAVVALAANNAFHGRQGWKQLARAAYRGYLGAATRPAKRVVVKDPAAALMTTWIARQFTAQVLIVMRHPCGFASSVDALDWPLNTNALIRQQALMRDHLEQFRDTLHRAGKDKWLTRGAFWAAIHTVFARQLQSHVGWHLCRYEDLCSDPGGQFSILTQKLGLEMGQRVYKRVQRLANTASTDPGSNRRDSKRMPDIWRQRMSPGQIDAVMGMVREFGLSYY